MNITQNYSKDISITEVNKLGVNKDHEVSSLKLFIGHRLPEHQHIFCNLLQ